MFLILIRSVGDDADLRREIDIIINYSHCLARTTTRSAPTTTCSMQPATCHLPSAIRRHEEKSNRLGPFLSRRDNGIEGIQVAVLPTGRMG